MAISFLQGYKRQPVHLEGPGSPRISQPVLLGPGSQGDDQVLCGLQEAVGQQSINSPGHKGEGLAAVPIRPRQHVGRVFQNQLKPVHAPQGAT